MFQGHTDDVPEKRSNVLRTSPYGPIRYGKSSGKWSYLGQSNKTFKSFFHSKIIFKLIKNPDFPLNFKHSSLKQI